MEEAILEAVSSEAVLAAVAAVAAVTAVEQCYWDCFDFLFVAAWQSSGWSIQIP